MNAKHRKYPPKAGGRRRVTGELRRASNSPAADTKAEMDQTLNNILQRVNENTFTEGQIGPTQLVADDRVKAYRKLAAPQQHVIMVTERLVSLLRSPEPIDAAGRKEIADAVWSIMQRYASDAIGAVRFRRMDDAALVLKRELKKKEQHMRIARLIQVGPRLKLLDNAVRKILLRDPNIKGAKRRKAVLTELGCHDGKWDPEALKKLQFDDAASVQEWPERSTLGRSIARVRGAPAKPKRT